MRNKRDKAWRQYQQNKKVKRRLKHASACSDIFITNSGRKIYNPKWIDLLKSSLAHDFQSTGTPCSCEICSFYKYDRNKTKNDTIFKLKQEDLL